MPKNTILKAFPLLFSKNLEIAVVDVCDIRPWPDILNKNNPTNKKIIPFINEKIKAEIAKKITTKSE